MGDDRMSKNETIRELYNQCKDMDIEETIELVLDAKTQEEQEFFSLVSDFVLQKKQEEVIRNKRF
jgi:hypothetical protein